MNKLNYKLERSLEVNIFNAMTMFVYLC